MTIRPLGADEFDAAAALIRASFATVAADFGLTESNCPSHTSFITADRLRRHADAGSRPYGLDEDDVLVGFVALTPRPGGVVELHNLAVLPAARHRHHGRQLVAFCQETTRQWGAQRLTLSLIEENTVLKDWYAAQGFVPTAVQRFDHLPFTVGVMEWTVPA